MIPKSSSLFTSSGKFAAKFSGEAKIKNLQQRSLPLVNPSADSQVDKSKLYVTQDIPLNVLKMYGEEPEEFDDTDDLFLSFISSVRQGTEINPFSNTNQPEIRKKLPPNTVGFKIQISNDLIEILKGISQMTYRNPIYAIQAPTGVGKSIGIPWIIIKNNPTYKVMVSVPTRANVISLYRSMIKYDPEMNVGYAADREINYTKDTNIIYATAGHLRNLLLRNIKDGICGDLDFADILMIDEIHLGTIDNDIIQSLWERCAQMVNVYPRLILSSAFIDDQKYPNVPRYTVSTKSFPVETIYHHKTFSPYNQEVYLDLANVITEYHLKEPLTNHFLVFAPGKGEINKIMRQLKVMENAIILPAYSNLERSDLDKIYDDAPGKRKIIIATNIAETGITIENVGMVFDSLLEKRAETSTIGGLRMITTKIAQSSAEQRRGRTGRTLPGKYYVMCTEEDYSKLERTRPDEIERVPITDLIMTLVTVGLDPLTVIKKLTSEKKEKAFNVLQYLKLIDYDRQYVVTEKGNFISEFELSVYNSSSLYDILNTVPNIQPLHVAVLLTMIDMVDQSYFHFPPTPADKTTREFRLEYRSRFEKYKGSTDIHVFGNIWNDLMNKIGGLISFSTNDKRTWILVSAWAQENGLNNRQIKEMLKSLLTTLTTMSRLGYVMYQDLQSSLMDVNDVIDKIRPILAVNYDGFSLRLRDGDNKNFLNYVRLETGNVYNMDTTSTMNTITKTRPKWIIALNHNETLDSNRRILRFVTVFLDIEKFEYFSAKRPRIRKQKEQQTKEVINETALIPELIEYDYKKSTYPIIYAN